MIEEIKDSPQARILENHLLALTGGFVTCVQLYFTGLVAGSEFLTYAVDKLYLALNVKAGFGGALVNAVYYCTFYNQANAVSFIADNTNPYWDTTAAAYKAAGNYLSVDNIFFSRVTLSSYLYFSFNGYKITF